MRIFWKYSIWLRIKSHLTSENWKEPSIGSSHTPICEQTADKRDSEGSAFRSIRHLQPRHRCTADQKYRLRTLRHQRSGHRILQANQKSGASAADRHVSLPWAHRALPSQDRRILRKARHTDSDARLWKDLKRNAEMTRIWEIRFQILKARFWTNKSFRQKKRMTESKIHLQKSVFAPIVINTLFTACQEKYPYYPQTSLQKKCWNSISPHKLSTYPQALLLLLLKNIIIIS